MKKACAVVLSILLMLCLTNVAFASGLETSCVDMALAEAALIAYLDLEDASAEMREEILAAREKIIFRRGLGCRWVYSARGGSGRKYHPDPACIFGGIPRLGFAGF